jgi:DNA-binding LacI/PurR family transcriptional regulator
VSDNPVTDRSDKNDGSPVGKEDFEQIFRCCCEIATLRDHPYDKKQEEIKKGKNVLDAIARAALKTGFVWPQERPLRIGVGGDMPLPTKSFHSKYSCANTLLLAPAALRGLHWNKQPRIEKDVDVYDLIWGEIRLADEVEAFAPPKRRRTSSHIPEIFTGVSAGKELRILMVEGAHGRSYWDLFMRGASTTAEVWGIDLIPCSINSCSDRVSSLQKLLHEILSPESITRPKVHGILACSTGSAVTEGFFNAAREKEIVILETSYSDSRIRTDKQKWAELMYEGLVPHLAGKPLVVITEDGSRPNSTGIIAQRRDKLLQLLVDPPGAKALVKSEQIVWCKCDGTFESVSSSLVQWFVQKGRLGRTVVIIALTTEMTTGVLHAFLKQPTSIQKQVSVFGTDFASRTVWELQEPKTPLKAVVGIDPFRLGQFCIRAMLQEIADLSEGRPASGIQRYVVAPELMTYDAARKERISCASDLAEARPGLRLWDRQLAWPAWMAEACPRALWNLTPEQEATRLATRKSLTDWISQII